ncbi:hypothetical protein ACFRSX_34690 [Streptomyces goshikiensis]|uniref:hypothetical protein n=1 Tax=Streptomyces TaxID=1883 RepID=UPI000C273DD2|nr:hypothetical protein [Streptomyces sp. CB02120-2]PJN13970.1 hypothetical protein CG724_36730 [Streptomyces sp. CB02120-2]
MSRLLPGISLVSNGQQPQSWLLPVLVAVLAGGAGSQLPVEAWIRVTILVVVLVVIVRASLTRVISAE